MITYKNDLKCLLGEMTLKRLYSGNIGKKILLALFFMRILRTNKISWERIEIYFRGTQKSEKNFF